MVQSLRNVYLFLLVISLVLMVSGKALPCSVPVFRYALEHWNPDNYQALVFYDGELAEQKKQLIERFSDELTNLTVETIDLASQDKSQWHQVWESIGGESLPWIAVRADPRSGMSGLITSQPFTKTVVDKLIQSPIRNEIFRRITGGESAVWLLLESGNAEADAAALHTLQQRLDYLVSVLELPELDQKDIAEGLISVEDDDLRLAFSTIRISREQSDESFLIKMLLASEHDLSSLDEPLIFPIFGRGRVLFVLAGKGINAENIDESALFLIGQCSCQIKEENPGVDLLMSGDWTAFLRSDQIRENNSTEKQGTTAETIRFSSQPETNKRSNIILKIGGLVLLVLGVAIYLFRLRSKVLSSSSGGA